MTAGALPPALAPWSASLDFLSVEAAVHIGPLVRRIEAIVRRHDAVTSRLGEPDGYEGLTTRGNPEQMLLSEWLLAEEVPMEFLRRAANRELLHVSLAARSPQPRGRVAAVFDVEPDQLGACRLVQLAALIVLHRRARDHGGELAIATTRDAPGEWHTGELPELFAAWRDGRHGPTVDQAERFAGLGSVDEVWVLSGQEAARQWPGDALLLRIAESGWDAAGATQVEIRFEGRTTALALPPGPLSVRTLRGSALRRRSAQTLLPGAGSYSMPIFASADRRLLMRGETADKLVTVTIPAQAPGGAGRPRTHRFAGPVLAAAPLGRRTAALVHDGDDVELHMVGKQLMKLKGLHVPVSDLPVEALDVGAIAPLFYESGNLLCCLGETWWRLAPGHPPVPDASIVAVGPGFALDNPRIVVLVNGDLRDKTTWKVLAKGVERDTLEILCATRAVAWSTGGVWHLQRDQRDAVTLAIPGDEAVIGIVADGLITRSGEGKILRHHTTAAVKTLTAVSGIALAHAVHPALPLVAVQRDEETVDVRDIETGALVLRVGGQ